MHRMPCYGDSELEDISTNIEALSRVIDSLKRAYNIRYDVLYKSIGFSEMLRKEREYHETFPHQG
jgi:hypothetical protein